MNYSIRPAKSNDYPAICQLITTPEEFYWTNPKGQFPFTVEQLETIANDRIELTVITRGEEVVGFANFYQHQPQSHVFIGNLMISEAHRQKGLAKRMIQYLIDVSKSQYRLPELRISVFSDNSPALIMYHQLGFVPYQMEERTTPSNQRAVLIHLKKNLSLVRM